jgi:protein-S-isoprenylcysteine O-methyltransferase Ste14
MDGVRRSEWIFWTFVASIVAMTTATIILDRGYVWPLVNIGELMLYAGLAVMAAGYALRLLAIRTLGSAFSNILKVKDGQKIVRSGLYARVRHPAYTGTLIMVAGIPFVFSSPLGLLPVSLAIPAVLYRISVEERMLVERFGAEYSEYVKETKMLLPYIL